MRTWIEAYNRADMETLLAVTRPDFEFRTSGIFLGIDPVYQGHAGYTRFFEDFTANPVLMPPAHVRGGGTG
jgi:SnoaL-like domain